MTNESFFNFFNFQTQYFPDKNLRKYHFKHLMNNSKKTLKDIFISEKIFIKFISVNFYIKMKL